MKIACIILLLCVLAFPAHAGDWILSFITTDDSGATTPHPTRGYTREGCEREMKAEADRQSILKDWMTKSEDCTTLGECRIVGGRIVAIECYPEKSDITALQLHWKEKP